MSQTQIIVVDDELAIRQVLADKLRKAANNVEEFGDAESALERLSKEDVDIAICDIRMPGMNGIDLIRKTREAGIDTSFLLITAHASMDSAIEAMRLGAFDYMLKPVHSEEVLHQVKQIKDLRALRNENRFLRSIVLKKKTHVCTLASSQMQDIEHMVSRVARTDSTVLITGDSGTGKGYTARQIHNLSNRNRAPFIPVNCGSIPENLIESEFFGHSKGAFTGADKAKNGLFVEADRGTLFLDEIGELPLHLQVKLLHVLENREIRPVGSDKSRRIDVRIVAATNRDLARMVREGHYREDLFFRLNVFHINMPPLRERNSDTRTLIEFFLKRDADRFAEGRTVRLSPEAEHLLLNYDWPGNIREVENVIARLLILSDGDTISVNDLPPHIRGQTVDNGTAATPLPGKNLRDQVRIYEYNLIMQAIEAADGDRSIAAKNLGIGQSTLYRKLDEFERMVRAREENGDND